MSEQPPAPKAPRAKTQREAVDDNAPWKPPHYEPADVGALQALRRGDCPAHLQQRALNFILFSLCGLRDLSYRPGGEDGRRDTDFAEGRRFVGLQIGKLLEAKISKDGEQP
jgi:hypothetical protein